MLTCNECGGAVEAVGEDGVASWCRCPDVAPFEPAIARTKTTPQSGRIRIDFSDGDGIAHFAELIATLARLGKTVELSIKVIED